MNRYRVQVTEINTEPAAGAPAETEVFKLVIDQFEPAAFTRAITAQPKRRRKKTAETAA